MQLRESQKKEDSSAPNVIVIWNDAWCICIRVKKGHTYRSYIHMYSVQCTVYGMGSSMCTAGIACM